MILVFIISWIVYSLCYVFTIFLDKDDNDIQPESKKEYWFNALVPFGMVWADIYKKVKSLS
jgi:hypothetical protein